MSPNSLIVNALMFVVLTLPRKLKAPVDEFAGASD
jgi:hypothetical protein